MNDTHISPVRLSPWAALPVLLAGAFMGAMTTAQQVGYALGVALTGVIFFAARRQGIAHAFVLSLLELAALGACVLLTTRLLPAPARLALPPRPARPPSDHSWSESDDL